MDRKSTGYFIIGTFVTLYLLVSVISTIHVIDFFKLSNPTWLAVSLAIAFEVGAAASLASLITLDKMNKGIVWGLFIILTLMQAMGNTYYAYTHLQNFQGWIELFGLSEEDLIYQKRVLSMVSGAILPIVALGFIKSLVDYIRPPDEVKDEPVIKEDVDAKPIDEQVSELDIDNSFDESVFFVEEPVFPTEPNVISESTPEPSNVSISISEEAQREGFTVGLPRDEKRIDAGDSKNMVELSTEKIESINSNRSYSNPSVDIHPTKLT